MKAFTYFLGIHLICILYFLRAGESAAIICEDTKLATSEVSAEKSHNKTTHVKQPESPQESEINKFLHRIQCSLEKAKPWMDELQKEAKRLEVAAKRLGLGILNSFGEFINKLAEEDHEKPVLHHTNVVTTDSVNGTSTESVVTEVTAGNLCPEGFVADHNGICERIGLND